MSVEVIPTSQLWVCFLVDVHAAVVLAPLRIHPIYDATRSLQKCTYIIFWNITCNYLFKTLLWTIYFTCFNNEKNIQYFISLYNVQNVWNEYWSGRFVLVFPITMQPWFVGKNSIHQTIHVHANIYTNIISRIMSPQQNTTFLKTWRYYCIFRQSVSDSALFR